jgi:hypothetical protein
MRVRVRGQFTSEGAEAGQARKSDTRPSQRGATGPMEVARLRPGGKGPIEGARLRPGGKGRRPLFVFYKIEVVKTDIGSGVDDL